MAKQHTGLQSTSGGSAAAGGMDYQHRVAAWAAVQILAERDSTLPWNLGTDGVFESFRCETEQPVDDLLVETLLHGRIFAQVKHTLNLSRHEKSDLASSLDQFVRQFITCRNGTIGMEPLDPMRDRLVLITSSNSSKPIRDYLTQVLDRLRNLPKNAPLDTAAVNANEHRVTNVLRECLKSYSAARLRSISLIMAT